MDLWEVPEWGIETLDAIAYPSLQAAGQVGRKFGKHNKGKEETVLERLIQGTVRLPKTDVPGAWRLPPSSHAIASCSIGP